MIFFFQIVLPAIDPEWAYLVNRRLIAFYDLTVCSQPDGALRGPLIVCKGGGSDYNYMLRIIKPPELGVYFIFICYQLVPILLAPGRGGKRVVTITLLRISVSHYLNYHHYSAKNGVSQTICIWDNLPASPTNLNKLAHLKNKIKCIYN